MLAGLAVDAGLMRQLMEQLMAGLAVVTCLAGSGGWAGVAVDVAIMGWQ